MFLIRSIESKDLESFYRLASILNTYNLPKDRKLLAGIIRTSVNSFQDRLRNLHEGRYVFVAEELASGKAQPRRPGLALARRGGGESRRVVGTSEILAKRGRVGNPFIFCDVGEDCMESKTIHRRMEHRYLKLRWTEDGATEIGGLVVDPRYRGKGRGIGKALSYARLMYMKARPSRFQKRVLAELLAYLTPRGENPLWNVLGRHFTGLSYHQADRLSVKNKEFILSLFPCEKIYTCLFPERVQEILEKPGPHTIPAQKILERIGFKYLHQIDPFDGGPLYGARTREISICRDTKAYRYQGTCRADPTSEGLVLSDKGGKVRACRASVKLRGQEVQIDSEAARALQVIMGEKIWVYLYKN